MPKLMYLLRSSPTFQHPDLLADFDDCLKSCATDICNVSFDDIGWIQATLPIRLRGIGLRRASDLAFPAYLASISASQSLISEITQPDNIPHTLDSCLDVWSSTNPSLPENTNLHRQWDDIKSSSRSVALRPLLDQHRPACLSSATQPNSGAWMNCLPSTAIGTMLDSESFRIAISQRLGLPVCAPHKCRCGAIVDRYGLHPHSYRLSAGRLPRHSAFYDIIKCALSSAGFNAVHEPVCHDRGDGKRPDGMTVFPFSMGKCLIWDCTCVDSFSPSALALTATVPGSASRSAEVRKNLRYEGLCDRYIIQAIAIESSCVYGWDTNAFISRLGHLTTSISGERREAEFLRQRLTKATVRGNAQSVTQAGLPSSWIGIALCYTWIALC